MKFCLLFFIPTSCSPVRTTHLTGLLLSWPSQDCRAPRRVASLKAFLPVCGFPLWAIPLRVPRRPTLLGNATMCHIFPTRQNYDTNPRFMYFQHNVLQRPVAIAALVPSPLVDMQRRASCKKPPGKSENPSDDKAAESCISSFVIHFIDITWCFNENGVSLRGGKHLSAWGGS